MTHNNAKRTAYWKSSSLFRQTRSDILVNCFLKYSEQDSDQMSWKETKGKVTFIYTSLQCFTHHNYCSQLLRAITVTLKNNLCLQSVFLGEQVLSHKSLHSILSPCFLLLMYQLCYLNHSTLPFYASQYMHKEEVGKKQSCALLCREKCVKQSFLRKDKSESRVFMYQTLWTRLKRR